MSVNSKMTAIADTIRSYTKETEKLSLDGMAEKIALVHSKGYDSGFNQGYTDGSDAEYNRGCNKNCLYTFLGNICTKTQK